MPVLHICMIMHMKPEGLACGVGWLSARGDVEAACPEPAHGEGKTAGMAPGRTEPVV